MDEERAVSLFTIVAWFGLAVFLVISIMALAFASRGYGHDFYSAYCCSGRDCSPAVLGDVQWTPAGYAVQSTKEIVPLNDSRIQYSPPGEPGYRLCIIPGTGKVRCLYIPEPES